ncbi:hypothetical protein HDU80_002888 [Chytriomyces hyalinus]|nr:hypothetical protein HDU80_002888 [Chytriomyces hyalinus]
MESSSHSTVASTAASAVYMAAAARAPLPRGAASPSDVYAPTAKPASLITGQLPTLSGLPQQVLPVLESSDNNANQESARNGQSLSNQVVDSFQGEHQNLQSADELFIAPNRNALPPTGTTLSATIPTNSPSTSLFMPSFTLPFKPASTQTIQATALSMHQKIPLADSATQPPEAANSELTQVVLIAFGLFLAISFLLTIVTCYCRSQPLKLAHDSFKTIESLKLPRYETESTKNANKSRRSPKPLSQSADPENEPQVTLTRIQQLSRRETVQEMLGAHVILIKRDDSSDTILDTGLLGAVMSAASRDCGTSERGASSARSSMFVERPSTPVRPVFHVKRG